MRGSQPAALQRRVAETARALRAAQWGLACCAKHEKENNLTMLVMRSTAPDIAYGIRDVLLMRRNFPDQIGGDRDLWLAVSRGC